MQVNYLEALINIILASLGGLVKRIAEHDKDPQKKVSRSYYMAGSVIATFVGIVAYILCKNFNVSQMLTMGVTSLAGYAGSPVLDLLTGIAKKKLLNFAEPSGAAEAKPLEPV